MSFDYIERFKKLGFGIFVHFGLYSIIGKGEWYKTSASNTEFDDLKYNNLKDKFNIKKNWAKE